MTGTMTTEAIFTEISTTSIDADVDLIRTIGYAAVGDGGAADYKRVGSEPSHPGKVQSADGAWWEVTGDHVHVRQFGAFGLVDDQVAIQNAIHAAYVIGTTQLIFAVGVQHSISGSLFFNSYGVLLRALNVFNLDVQLTAATAGGGVVNIGRGANVGDANTIERTGTLTFNSPRIDGAGIAGENGFGIARAENILILNPSVQNCKRDYVGTREGGRGITVHSRCKNVTIIGYQGINCSDYLHVAHQPDYSAAGGGVTIITALTRGATTVITLASNDFSVGEFVFLYGVGGTTGLNPNYGNATTLAYEVLSSSGSQVTIDVDSSSMGAWTSGGHVVRADLFDEGRSPSVSLMGGHAEDCEYSLIDIEGSNWPHTIKPYQSVFVSGLTAKNCGTTSTRGLINGNNACRLETIGMSVFNDADHPVNSIVRGSFQGAKITGTFDIHTLNDAVIDADPTEENPVETGIDAGITTFPYCTSLDNEYDLKFICRGVPPATLIHATNISGSVERFYRNDIRIKISGLVDGARFTGTVNDIAMHFRNFAEVIDLNNGHSFHGPLTTSSLTMSPYSGMREFVGATFFAEGVILKTYTGSEILDASSVVNTKNKFTGTVIRDGSHQRLMVSNGTSPTSTWKSCDGGVVVTPS